MADAPQETEVDKVAGVVGDIADETELTQVVGVAGVVNMPHMTEGTDEARLVGVTEVMEKGGVADLVNGEEVDAGKEDVANLNEMAEVGREEDVDDLGERGELLGKEDDADLDETTEVAEKQEVAGFEETTKAAKKEDGADLAGMSEMAEKAVVPDLMETGHVAQEEGVADLAEMRKVVEEAVPDSVETSEVFSNEVVADKGEIAEAAEEQDMAELAEMREVGGKEVGPDLRQIMEAVKKDNVAELAETREIVEKEAVVDLVERMEVAKKGDVAKLAEMREVAGKEVVSDLGEKMKAAKEKDEAELAEMREDAEKEVAACLVEMEIAGKKHAGDLVDIKEVAEEDVANLPEMTEVAEKEELAELPEETYTASQVVEDMVLPGPIAEETDLAGTTGEEAGLPGPVAEDMELGGPTEMDMAGLGAAPSDIAGPVRDEMNLSRHFDDMEEAANEADVADMTNEAMEAGEELAEEALEADEIEAVEMIEMAEDTTEAEETEAAEEMEATEEMEVVEASKGSGGGKRKRGKNSRAPARVPMRKKVEEDVCFICFDGGDLVLCDRRGCPKAYHPSCVNRDEAFFRAKGRWNCGWHLCSNCEKNAYYMCYTCTFSLCKACIKDSVILCVRGNKGFCQTCMKTVTLIEHNLQGNKDMGQVDFDDKNSWEYLFKDYWIDLKERLSLTLDDLNQAKNPYKAADVLAGKQESPDELYDANNDERSDSESSGNIEITNSKRKKAKKRLRLRSKEGDSKASATETGGEGPSTDGNAEWASKELLEFVMHMKGGGRSVLSQFDVQALLLEYIKRNKLRDPRRKSQIICDSRLQSLFGKPRVGHFEMLKLLESHFLIKEDSQADDLQGSVVDTEASQVETDGNSDALGKTVRDKKRKTRKKGDERGPQSNLDDYAAIDIHNINLIYLRRNLVEELLEDIEKFQDKVVGSFVRIRISGSGQKQDLYRLVQVVGTCKASEPYKVGKRMTDILLEILNLNKTEIIPTDIISNQEFTEDECKRLRQSIKCGLINRLTVGDIQERAMALQEVRVKDWLETEILRLSHLRDRASEKGRRKELRECVEKLQLLKTPEERQRRLEEIPEIHADPHMDPSYESEEDEGETDDKRQETYMRPRGTGFGRRAREPVSPQTGVPAFSESWGGTRNYSDMNRELGRNLSNKGLSYKGDDITVAGEILNERNQVRDIETSQVSNWEKQKIAASLDMGASKIHSLPKADTVSTVPEVSAASLSITVAQSSALINETEKIWHYQDPSGKVQGPFSMAQLRKWNNTGYFPANLRIWRTTEGQDGSVLLTDALAGKLQKDSPLVDNSFPKAQAVHNAHILSSYPGKPHGASLQQGVEGQVGERSNFDQNSGALNAHASLGSSGQSAGGSWRSQTEMSPAGRQSTLSVEVPKASTDSWGSNYRNDSTNLPSPTPIQSTSGVTKRQLYESKWSHNPVHLAGSVMGTSQFSGANGGMQPPGGAIPESAVRGSESNGASSHLGVTPVPKPENHMLIGSLNAFQMHAQSTSPSSGLADASMSPGADLKNSSSNLHNLDQSVANRNPPIETKGWGSGLVQKPEISNSYPTPGSEQQAWGSAPSQKVEPNTPATIPVQPLAHGHWANASSVHSSASSFSSGNPLGNFSAGGFSGLPPSDPWRHSVPGNQSNIQPPAPPTLNWGMGVTENQAATRPGSENQNPGWGPVPGNVNLAWGGPVPANANINWGASGQGPAPGNASAGWAAPAQAAGNAVSGWVPASQGLPLGNANPGWVAPGQGPPPGNANTGWVAPTANPGNHGNHGNHADRFANSSVRGSHGVGDAAHGGIKAWNRQSSFGGGGGGSRPPFKGQRVCKFHESGHCKKGASCDYLHP